MTPAYGADPDRFQLIPRVLLIVTHEDRVLLIRRSEHKKLWPGKYNAPGGHMELGEDPYAAGLRELVEETGVRVGEMRLRGLITAETGLPGSGILVFVFQAEALEPELRGGPEGEPLWAERSTMVERRSLHDLDLLPDLPQILELVLDQPAFFYLYKIPQADGGERVEVRLAGV